MSASLPLDLWHRAEALFEAILDRPAAERAAFLRHVCGAEETLVETVEALLRRDEAGSSFLEEPLVESRRETLEPSPRERLLGRCLGPYRLLRLIGSGGMSDVFLGQRIDGEFEQQVAIKVIREGAVRGGVLNSLRRERQILTKLNHPNIARSLDGSTTEEGISYVVLEYLEGIPVTEYCDTARLDIRQRLELFSTICHAVDYAHRRFVVHSDLKPSNILVTGEGEPKLLDFGIAKLLDVAWDGTSEGQAQTQERFFTPSYASPEQIAGESVSMASDVYSLGILLYQLLTGLRPCDLESLSAKLSGGGTEARAWVRPSSASLTTVHGLEPPTLRSEVRGTTPSGLQRQLLGDLDSIVRHCLRRLPESRYRSAAALEQDLRRHLADFPVLARSPSLPYRLKKFVRRHRFAVALSAAALHAAVGLGLGLILKCREVERERGRAERARVAAEQVTRFLTEAFSLADPLGDSDSNLRASDQVTWAKS